MWRRRAFWPRRSLAPLIPWDGFTSPTNFRKHCSPRSTTSCCSPVRRARPGWVEGWFCGVGVCSLPSRDSRHLGVFWVHLCSAIPALTARARAETGTIHPGSTARRAPGDRVTRDRRGNALEDRVTIDYPFPWVERSAAVWRGQRAAKMRGACGAALGRRTRIGIPRGAINANDNQPSAGRRPVVERPRSLERRDLLTSRRPGRRLHELQRAARPHGKRRKR